MAGPNLVLLGPPHIERDGTIVDVDTRKAIALLAYLVVTRRHHTCDAIAALLWPEYDQPHARAAVRRTLSSLNKAVPECLESDRDTIGLNPHGDLVVDLQEMQGCLAACRTHGHPPTEICAACVQPLTEALALYGDDFMAGFSLRDSAAFDDWQLLQAENLRREVATALDCLVSWHTNETAYEAAIGYARRRLALDSLHEATHRALMQLYVWSRQRNAALQQYRDCARVLADELGVEPLLETTQLYEVIKDNTPPPPHPERLAAPTHIGTAPTVPKEAGGDRPVRRRLACAE